MILYGLDFTSAPSPHKPITCAQCRLEANSLILESVECLTSFAAFEEFLRHPGPWVAGLDFPFGQPRRLVENLGWGHTWEDYVRRVADMGKDGFVQELGRYRSNRDKGDKQHLRHTDKLACSCSPMMLYGVPVGKMFYEGAHRLLESGASIPPCHPRDDPRVVLEAYPGLAARHWVGKRSYKNDTRSKQTLERQAARADIVCSLRSDAAREYYGFTIQLDERWAGEFLRDGSGDRLDALLCAIQAGWAYSQRERNYGIPADCDTLEGWIVDPAMVKAGGN